MSDIFVNDTRHTRKSTPKFNIEYHFEATILWLSVHCEKMWKLLVYIVVKWEKFKQIIPLPLLTSTDKYWFFSFSVVECGTQTECYNCLLYCVLYLFTFILPIFFSFLIFFKRFFFCYLWSTRYTSINMHTVPYSV